MATGTGAGAGALGAGTGAGALGAGTGAGALGAGVGALAAVGGAPAGTACAGGGWTATGRVAGAGGTGGWNCLLGRTGTAAGGIRCGTPWGRGATGAATRASPPAIGRGVGAAEAAIAGAGAAGLGASAPGAAKLAPHAPQLEARASLNESHSEQTIPCSASSVDAIWGRTLTGPPSGRQSGGIATTHPRAGGRWMLPKPGASKAGESAERWRAGPASRNARRQVDSRPGGRLTSAVRDGRNAIFREFVAVRSEVARERCTLTSGRATWNRRERGALAGWRFSGYRRP